MRILFCAVFCFASVAPAGASYQKQTRAQKRRANCQRAFHLNDHSPALNTIKTSQNPEEKQKAINSLKQKAKKDPLAMTRLGEFYMAGVFIPKDQERGISLLIKAGKKGFFDAINHLGHELIEGRLDDTQHEGLVISLLIRFAKKGHHNSIGYLGIWLLKQESPLSPNAQKALDLLEEKANEKRFMAQYYFGQWLMRGESSADKKRAFQLLKQLVLKGHFDSLNFLGQSLLDGHLTQPQDKEEMIDMLAHSASKGQYQAVFHLGLWLVNEKKFFKDITREIGLVEQSANKGMAYSMYHFGRLLFEGEALPQDIERSLNLLIQSGGRGIYDSLNYLGQKLVEGHLASPQNRKRVIGLLARFSEKGDSQSLHWLRQYLSTGNPSAAEAKTIVSHIEFSASSGNSSAISYLDKWREKNPGALYRERSGARDSLP